MGKNVPLPPIEDLRSIFDYDPDPGVLTWRSRPREHFKNGQAFLAWNTKFANRPAGTHLGIRRYLVVSIVGVGRFYVHRVIWKLMSGEDPISMVDHRDGDSCNNRWSNLRQATNTENQYNRQAADVNNISGLKGVCWDRQNKKWLTRITAAGKHYYLGRFFTREAAQAAYAAASANLHGEFSNIGEKR